MINLITDCDLIKVQKSLLPSKLYNQTHQSTMYSKYFYEWLCMNKEKNADWRGVTNCFGSVWYIYRYEPMKVYKGVTVLLLILYIHLRMQAA